jgi:hypothetical protein
MGNIPWRDPRDAVRQIYRAMGCGETLSFLDFECVSVCGFCWLVGWLVGWLVSSLVCVFSDDAPCDPSEKSPRDGLSGDFAAAAA